MNASRNTTAFIYSLDDPLTLEARYIGKTHDPMTRLKAHQKRENTRKSRWIHSLKKRGLRPTLTVIAEVPVSEWQFWEQFCIELYRECGFKLVNGDNGGLGSDRLPQAVRQKIRNALKGRKNYALALPYAKYSLQGELLHVYPSCADAERDLGLSHCNIVHAAKRHTMCGGFLWRKADSELPMHADRRPRVPHSEEVRRRIAQKNKGRLASDEARIKMSLSAKARRSNTHCKNGHALTPDNVGVDGEGFRACIACRRLQTNNSYRKKVQTGWRRNPAHNGGPAWLPRASTTPLEL